MNTLTCREFIEFLDDYAGGELSAERRAAFEEHIRACPECTDYLETYRETIRLTKSTMSATGDDAPPPPEAPEDLIQAILKSR